MPASPRTPTAAYQRADKPKLETLESVVFLAARDSMNSSATGSQDPSKPADQDDDPTTAAAAAPIALGLSIRRSRLAIITFVVVAIIIGIVFTFNRGVEISQLSKSQQTNSTAQTKLLDDYNSYSANIATAFSKPIDVFVTIAVQIVVLRFMANEITERRLEARCRYDAVWAWRALRPQEIYPVISLEDLSAEFNVSTTPSQSTNVTQTISELTPRNSITNTVLRSAVLPRVSTGQPVCTAGWDWQETTVDYGFTPRDWQRRVLQTAAPTTQWRTMVNATDPAMNKGVQAKDLPMNASLAADLFIYGFEYGRYLMKPWGESWDGSIVPDFSMKFEKPADDSMAKGVGLLPPDRMAADETKQREWFVEKATAGVIRQFKVSRNTSRSNIVMEFSRVPIAPSITFDAMTIEFEMDPALFDAQSQGTIDIVNKDHCARTSPQCLFAKPLFGGGRTLYDVPSQVKALAVCLNKQGTEQLKPVEYYPAESSTPGFPVSRYQCDQKSNSSLLVFSIAKRLVADSIAPKTIVSDDRAFATVTGMRKIYSLTVGRLSWEFVDLATEFNAECGSPGTCTGLQLPLENAAQRLVVGANGLPLASLGPPVAFNSRALPLVTINEQPRYPPESDPLFAVGDIYKVANGDLLLPHNIRNIKWTQTNTSAKDCSADVEIRVNMTLNNHIYMEHSLQPAYTAATFFLFQNAVVKDALRLNSGKSTLRFQNNVQDIAVWVSIPDQNAWLTYAGCAVLVLALLAAVIKAAYFMTKENDPLAAITAPDVIARVMLDDKNFPSMLLHRRVADKHESLQPRHIDQFAIDSLSVQHQGDRDRLESKQEMV